MGLVILQVHFLNSSYKWISYISCEIDQMNATDPID